MSVDSVRYLDVDGIVSAVSIGMDETGTMVVLTGDVFARQMISVVDDHYAPECYDDGSCWAATDSMVVMWKKVAELGQDVAL